MRLSHRGIMTRWKIRRQRQRMHLLVVAGILLGLFLLSLCFRISIPGFIPVETARNLVGAIRLGISRWLHLPFYLHKAEILHLPYYGETWIRLRISLLTIEAGMALGLSGAVFQQVYHNPIASPSTIGATAGVNLGNLIVVMIAAASAMQLVLVRHMVCIGLTLAIMILVLIAGKVMCRQGDSYSVLEMLMFGSILSRLITSFISYAMYHLSGASFIAYQQLTIGINKVFTAKSILIFFVILAAGMLPLLRMRFRLNALALDPIEAQATGVRLWQERIFSQLLAAVIIAAACVQCGDIGIFALVIPYLIRYMVGSDFRQLAIYSTMYGGVFLLVIRIITSVIFVGEEPLPMYTIVSAVMIPVFLIMLAMQKKGFDT